jgi:hypothetical protein
VAGPTGPHLFRLSDGTLDIKSSVEVDLVFEDTPISATTPFYSSASKLGPDRRDTPVPAGSGKPIPQNHHSQPVSQRASKQPSESNVVSWNPQDVVEWMQQLNVDAEIVEKFFINDISGSILLELQPEDLKELDIPSFGKRVELMKSIRQLRNSVSRTYKELPPIPPPESIRREATPQSAMADVGVTSCSSTPVPYDEESAKKEQEFLLCHQHQLRRHRGERVIRPDDSVSIVGIEQFLPKLHRCSKGEDCRKWQKQHAKLSRIAGGVPPEALGSPLIITGDPGNAATARNLAKTSKDSKSNLSPSIVASSDALGPVQPTELPISQEKLHDVRPRDPQENVRHFLQLQRLSRLRPVNDPATPPRETFPSPESRSPGTLSEHLRNLPKLYIPNDDAPLKGSCLSPPTLSGQRTITPSAVRRKQPFQDTILERSATPADSIISPSDYYRGDPHYGQSTPFSEMDVPLTAIQVGPVERTFSQSVPPDMRFRSHGAGPIDRPQSTKVDNHKRKPSYFSNNTPVLSRLDESRMMQPIETPEDLDRTPRAAHCRANPFITTGEFANDIIHAGLVKKRKTTRLLRHEWQEHYFALRGTQLAMYNDKNDSQQTAKALEYIDVDEYAVACSSLASSSKLTAAFKKTVLKRKDDTRGDTAFAFSLVPSPNSSTFDRKAIFTNGSKAHHFAVNTRDERIDWMRELMLAKALHRGRKSGASLNVNGIPI